MVVLEEDGGTRSYVIASSVVGFFHILSDYGDGEKGDYSYVSREILLTFPTDQKAKLCEYVNSCSQ